MMKNKTEGRVYQIDVIGSATHDKARAAQHLFRSSSSIKFLVVRHCGGPPNAVVIRNLKL